MVNENRSPHQHFEQWAESYDQSRYQRFIFHPVHQGVLRAIAENHWATGTVLDIGCGTGQLLERLAGAYPNAELIGVDPAEKMIEVARSRRQPTSRFRFEVGSAQELPLPDTSVDLALSTISAHHWPDLAAAAREIARVLRPGGHLLLVDFAPNGPFARLAFRFTPDWTHSPQARKAAFEQAGLALLYQRPLPGANWWTARCVLASAAERAA